MYKLSSLRKSATVFLILAVVFPTSIAGRGIDTSTLTQSENGVYTENFVTYEAKDSTDGVEWNIGAHTLKLSESPATDNVQNNPAVAIDEQGNGIIVWEDNRNSGNDIYAQKHDRNGNKLWAADVQVNFDSIGVEHWDPAVTVDGDGNISVVWKDNRSGEGEIYAQKLDTNGNKLWINDVKVNGLDDAEWRFDPSVTTDENGDITVGWIAAIGIPYDDAYGIYVQKLDGDGNKLWPANVYISTWSDIYKPLLYITSSGNGETVVTWMNSNGHAFCDISAQKLDANGNTLWDENIIVPDSDHRGNDCSRPNAIVNRENNSIWISWSYYSYTDYDDNIYVQYLNTLGNKLWPTQIKVNADAEETRQDPSMAIDGNNNITIVWTDNRNSNRDIYAQKMNESGDKLWATDIRVNSDNKAAAQETPSTAVTGDGTSLIAWKDDRNGNNDIYAQRINQVGSKVWLADLQVVYPDFSYSPTGTAQSRTVDTLSGAIRMATLTADYQTNGGSVQFYLTNDGGTSWAPVTPGVSHVFTSTGSDLRWKATLNVNPVWNRTPVVRSLRIDYSTQLPYADTYESDDTCAQAQPIQLNGAAQAHTFHQPDDSDWIWFDGQAGITYTLQIANTQERVDATLEVYDHCDQAPIVTDDDPFAPGVVLPFHAEATTRYYLRILQNDGAVYGDKTGYDLSIHAQQPTGAAIIVAGRLKTNDSLQPIINATANLAYATFRQHGFTDEDIYYLNADASQPGVDGSPTEDTIRNAIQDWARTRVGANAPLWLFLADHGDVDRFHNEVAQVVTAEELDLWLDNLEATSGVTQINVIIDACFSGSFIDTHQSGIYGLAEISHPGRVIVTSTSSRWWAYPDTDSSLIAFSKGFWDSLGNGETLWSAFLAGRKTIEANRQRCGDYDYTCQRPWLDDTGDAWFDSTDGTTAQSRSLPPSLAGTTAPYIDWVTVNGETLRAQVRDDGAVTQVWARIFAPSFTPPQSSDGSIPQITVPEVVLARTSEDAFTAEYADFTEAGSYQVVLYARDDEGNVSTPQWVFTDGGKAVYLPLVVRK